MSEFEDLSQLDLPAGNEIFSVFLESSSRILI